MAIKSLLKQSLLVALCIHGLLGWARPEAGDDLVARVNGEEIRQSLYGRSKSYLEKALRRQFAGDKLQHELARQELEILKTLIDERVLRQRAEALDIVPEGELVKYLDQMRRDNGLDDLESLERSFIAKGIDPKEFKHDLEQQLLKDRLLRTDADGQPKGSSQVIVDGSAEQKAEGQSSDLSQKGNSPASQKFLREYIQRLRRSSIIEVKHGFTDTGAAYTGDVNQDLLIAARIGDTPKLRTLVAQGANSNTLSPNGYSGLMHAAEMGHQDSVEVLLGNGAQLNVKSSSGDTALILAVVEGYQEIVKALLARGADPGVRDRDGVAPLIYASANCKTEIVRSLLERQADGNSGDNTGRTALIAATIEGCSNIVVALLAREADPNLTDSAGRTALIYAVESGRSNLIQVLLQKGARVNARDNEGKTALIYSILSGRLDVLRQLLLEPVDVNGTDNESQTPLMHAAAGGSERMVQMLLDAGADLKAGTWSTQLTRYNALGLPRVVPEAESQRLSSPLTALDIAKRTGQNAVVQVLEKAGQDNSADKIRPSVPIDHSD
jgi:ankyrin repeat protein